MHSHCNTCKALSGATYTLNQIIPTTALKISKGGDALGKYRYKGDSGKGVHCVCLFLSLLLSPSLSFPFPLPLAQSIKHTTNQYMADSGIK